MSCAYSRRSGAQSTPQRPVLGGLGHLLNAVIGSHHYQIPTASNHEATIKKERAGDDISFTLGFFSSNSVQTRTIL